MACHELGEAHESGYFGAPDLVAARRYYRDGAEQGNRWCWEALARCLRDGVGGPVDEAEAYYWISLESRCVDPRSVSGEETWQMREALAELLPLAVLEQQWAAIDAYIEQVQAGRQEIYSPRFGGTGVRESVWKEAQRLADDRERVHRSLWRETESAPPGAQMDACGPQPRPPR
jgi:hypothetical protein